MSKHFFGADSKFGNLQMFQPWPRNCMFSEALYYFDVNLFAWKFLTEKAHFVILATKLKVLN